MSSLSLYEEMSIKAGFEYMYRLRCKSLISEYQSKGYSSEVARTTVYKEHKCNSMEPKPIYIIDPFEFYTCPCNFQNPLINYLLICSDKWEQGVLPYPGSLSEQPAKLIEALILLENLKIEYKVEEQEKQNANNKR